MAKKKKKPDGPAQDAGYTAEDLQHLSDRDHVRERPAMYIGDTDFSGFHHLLWEVVDNSIDEAMAGHCNAIIVELLAGGVISVEDNGRGMPVDLHPDHKISGVEVIMINLHSGANNLIDSKI